MKNCGMRSPSRTLTVMKIGFVCGLLAITFSMPAQDSLQAQANQATNLAVPQFEQYKVKIYSGKPAVPVLRTPEDREYRTRIREGATAGPNFAGHYTVVIIGCGTELLSKTGHPLAISLNSGRKNLPIPSARLFSRNNSTLGIPALWCSPCIPNPVRRENSLHLQCAASGCDRIVY